jgi:hypothetical protein
VLEQRASEMMILALGAYHQGWSSNALVMETAHYSNGLAWLHYVGYEECYWACHKTPCACNDA